MLHVAIFLGTKPVCHNVFVTIWLCAWRTWGGIKINAHTPLITPPPAPARAAGGNSPAGPPEGGCSAGRCNTIARNTVLPTTTFLVPPAQSKGFADVVVFRAIHQTPPCLMLHLSPSSITTHSQNQSKSPELSSVSSPRLDMLSPVQPSLPTVTPDSGFSSQLNTPVDPPQSASARHLCERAVVLVGLLLGGVLAGAAGMGVGDFVRDVAAGSK